MIEPVIHLFISSPADVSAERRRAALVVERLNGEFAGRVRIEPILRKEHFYASHAGFQDQITKAATCDIVIAIFGGRIGTRLPDSFPLATDPRAIRVVKRPIAVPVTFAQRDGMCETLEGPVGVRAGDAVLTGVQGEHWPVQRPNFLASYTSPHPPD